jgi:diaminopimelate decarboxylase
MGGDYTALSAVDSAAPRRYRPPRVKGLLRRSGVLHCDGVALTDAAERHGTPLYLYSRSSIEDGYGRYARAFAPMQHRICYAIKANGALAILRVLARLGSGADIVSGMELRAAVRAGFSPEGIVFSGAGKTEAEIRLALEHGIAAFNVESEDEIERLGAAATAEGRTARVALRVNPGIDPRSHPYISTGLRESKFGVDITRARAVLDEARRRPGLRVVGLQCHIGSQIRDLEPLEESAREIAALSRALLEDGFPLETVNIGGGLGVDYDGAGAPTPEGLAARVLPALQGLPLLLLLEPGRSLVAAAGILLTRVLYVKEAHGRRFVIVDAGMNDLLRPALYAAVHRIEPVLEAAGAWRPADVVGPVCETGDFLARGLALPEVRSGDLLAVRDVGAYGFCMASNYNMRPRPAEVLVEEGQLRLIRRRETFEDLIAEELP